MPFRICDNKGFQITFSNGVTVSVQFGPGNYCGNYPNISMERFSDRSPQESNDCELAIFDSDRNWLTKEFAPDAHNDENYVLKALIWASEYKKFEKGKS